MEQATKNTHTYAAAAARPQKNSFSLILDEIFREDVCSPAAPTELMLGSSVFAHPVNGHGPSNNATACVELSGFGNASGGGLFPDNFCIGEDGESLICSLGPEYSIFEDEVSFENFSIDSNESEFIVSLVNFEENTKAKYGALETPPPSFDFTSITSKLTANEQSWKSLKTKAAQLVKTNRSSRTRTTAKYKAIKNNNATVRSDTPPTTHKRKLATNPEKLIMSEEVRRREAAESHRRATAKRSRIHGRFAKRQYVWVNVGADGRKIVA